MLKIFSSFKLKKQTISVYIYTNEGKNKENKEGNVKCPIMHFKENIIPHDFFLLLKKKREKQRTGQSSMPTEHAIFF